MKTASPIMLRLPNLDLNGQDARIGPPRVLVLLPKDGGRVIVTLWGTENVRISSVDYSHAEALQEAGAEAFTSDRFEPFNINGVPYRFDFHTRPEERQPYLYLNRIGGSVVSQSYTPAALSKIRDLCAEVAAHVVGFHVELVHEAERSEKARDVAKIEEKLAELATKRAELEAKREALGGGFRVSWEIDFDADECNSHEHAAELAFQMMHSQCTDREACAPVFVVHGTRIEHSSPLGKG